MTQVIACIDQSPSALAVCDYAIWASQRLAAPLTFLHVLDEIHYPVPTDLSGNIGLGSREHILEELASLDEQRARLGREHGQHLLDGAKKRAIDAGIEQPHHLQRHGELTETLKQMEAEIRLVVMGREGEEADKHAPHVGSHIENVVRTQQRPILITPQRYREITDFLIAFDGSVTSRKCVELIAASPLLKGLNCHLLLVGFESGETLDHMHWAEQTLASGGFAVKGNIYTGDTEDTLLNYCSHHHINLLCMGAYGHSRIRQFLVGSTTTHMISRAQVPLMLLR